MSDQGLLGKVAIVTGGATGIGRAISLLLAARGAKVAIVNRRAELAAQLAAEITAGGGIAQACPADVSQAAQVDAVVDGVLTAWGQLDILVNNAGIRQDSLIMRMKPEAWDLVLDINLKGAFYFIKAASRPMMKARCGRIINIASIVGLTGNPGQANYAAAKAGLIGLTKAAARELASRNITVNAIAPGYVVTDMTGDLSEEQKKAFLAAIPLGRPGTPEDIARAVGFLASSDAGYITGQTLTVDGGMVMT